MPTQQEYLQRIAGQDLRSASSPQLPQNQPQQKPPQSAQQPQQPAQPAGEWNYKDSPINPNGDVLPEGAEGWTPHGSPYFGQGIGGTLKKYAWMLTGDNPNKLIEKTKAIRDSMGGHYPGASTLVSEQTKKLQGEFNDELKNQFLQFLTPNDPNKKEDWAALKELGTAVKGANDQNAVVTTEEEKAANAAYNAQLWKNLEGTSVLSPVIKTMKVGVNVIMDVFSEAAIKFEQTQSVTLAMGDYVEAQGGTALQLDDTAQANEKYRGLARAGNIVRNLLLPILSSVDTFKFVLAPGTFADKKQAIESGWDAGKMLYSQTVTPAILDEFERRAKAGEDPELLAQELQNPWAEMVGQMILDPLNGVGALAKLGKLADVVNDASKVTRTVEEMATVADDLADLAKAPVGETRALETMNRVDESLQAALKAADERVTLQYGKGTSFTPAGYRTHWGKKVKSTTMLFTQAIMRNGGNTDDLAELAHYGAQLRSADKVTRMKALDGYMEISNKFKLGRTSFSEMALDTWTLIGKMTEGKGIDNLLGLLQKAKGNPAEFAEIATKLMDDAVKYSAPDFTDLTDAAKAVAAGAPTERQVELAGKLKDISPAAKKLQEINAGKFGTFKQKANNLLAKFYFGTYGPGVRNAMGNATHMIVDRGVGGTVSSFFRDGKYWSLDAIDTELKQFFGGELPPDLLGLSLAQDAGDDINKVLGVIPAPKGKILGILPTPGKFTDDTEKAFAKRIYWSNFRDTMDKALRPGVALPDMKTFKAAGMTESQVKDLVHIVKTETYGDIEKAIIKYGERNGEGGMDAWRAWSGFVDDDQMKGLRQVGMEQEINAIADMTDATPQKIKDEFARLRRSIEARAAEATKDPKGVSSARQEFSFLNELGKATDSGYLDADGMGQLNQRLETAANAQDEAMAALGRARDKYNQLVGQGVAQPLDFSVVEQVGSEARKLSVRNKTAGITDNAWAVTKKIKKGMPRMEMQKLWDASVMADTPMPANADEILKQLWNGTRFSVSQAWETHFADNFSQLIPVMEQLKATDPSLAAIFQKADKASAEAQQMRSAVFHNDRIYVQPPARNVAEVASRYKIPTSSEKGVPQWNQLSNKLKKMGMDVSPEDLRAGNNDPELMRAVEDTLKAGGDEAAQAGKAADATPNVEQGKAQPQDMRATIDAISKKRRGAPGSAEKNLEIEGKQYIVSRDGVNVHAYIKDGDSVQPVKLAEMPDEVRAAIDELKAPLPKTEGLGFKETNAANKKYLDEVGDTAYFDEADKAEAVARAPSIDDRIKSGELVEIAPKHIDDATPSAGRAWLENKQGYMDTLKSLEQKMLDNYGLKAVDKLDNKTLKNIKKLMLAEKDKNGLTAADKITEGIAMADRVGKHWRDFGLLPYGETRNYDLMASYAYPYQFWYSRSYKNWGTRLTTDPQVISNYARLKDTMAKENADSPEWWRYNVEIPSNFLGMGNDHPLSFNLEANIWPLYGLTGTDFNDPTKRADWWSSTIDDMGKMGPSTWAPISWAIAAYYSAKGEDEVSARWAGGGMVPQTKLVRNISSLIPENENVKFGDWHLGQPVQWDPLVKVFAGGVDPYERNRVGRILGQYAQDGKLPDGTPVTEEQLLEVARTQEGPIWEAAIRDAVRLRAGGDVAASFLGVGMKARPPEDAEIDKFYQDYHRLMSLSNAKLIPPDKIRESYDQLRDKYPFMDTVLLARKAGPDRERAYAYNILSRVPPGQASDLYKLVDIDPETSQKFYDNGGDLSFLSESERMKFMSGMIDLGAMLAIPELSTKQEWGAARDEYKAMKETVAQQFGKDIYDKIEHLYTLDGVEKDNYRAAHPELDAARQMENGFLSEDSLLYKYYGGIETLQQHHNGKMYEELDKKFGDVQPLFDHYYDLQLTDPKGATKFKKLHPEMDAYNKYKAGLKQDGLAALVRFAARLPDGPELDIRPDFDPANPTQQGLSDYTNQQAPGPQEFQQALGAPLMNIIQIYHADLTNDPSRAKLPYQADRELDYRAKALGYESGDDLLRAILISMQQGQP